MSFSTASDLPAASGLTGQTTELPTPGEYPEMDTQTQVPVIIGVSAAFMIISTIVVALRLYTRYGVIKVAGDDDITIGIAQLMNIGLIATTILQSAYGLGRHTWMVTQSDRTKQLELLLASEIIYVAAQTVTKVSLLLQYRRIFRGKWTRLACLVLYIFVVAWGIISIVLNSLACLPMALLNTSLAETCLGSLLVWSIASAVSIVTNFAVVAVPIPATWALQLPRKMRGVLTVLFGLGFCTGAVAIARILAIKKSALSLDNTWDSAPVTYYSVIEVNVGIICACIITLRPLLTNMFPSLIKSSYGGHGDAGYYTRDRHCGLGGSSRTTGGGGGGGGGAPGTKKSSRETMTHADHGIYGLADLEANQVLNGSQEGLTSSGITYFEPAHFSSSHNNSNNNNNNKYHNNSGNSNNPRRDLLVPRLPSAFSRMSTSITGGGTLPTRGVGEPRLPVHKIRTRSGEIMITRETTIREETMVGATVGKTGTGGTGTGTGTGTGAEKEQDQGSWLSQTSTGDTCTEPPHSSSTC